MSGTKLGCVIALFFALSVLVQLAVVKWLWERKQARRKAEARNQKPESRSGDGGPGDSR